MRFRADQLNPNFTLDLRLQPRQLDIAYWRQRLLRNKAYDTAGWLMLVIWLAALRDAPLYASYRSQLVVFGRVIFALFHCAAINNLKETIYEVVVLENPHMTLLYKFLLLELVKFGNTPTYITAADQLTSTWAALIQSVLTIPVPPCSRLAGRSTATFLSLTALHFTSVVVVLYAVYINIWVDVRLWLMSKLRSLEDRSMSSSTADVIEIGGVSVSGEQLQALYDSQAAALLLCNRGTGRIAALCLHAIAVGVVCQMALLASKLFVLQLVPWFLPQHMFEEFYPPAP
eukprot:gene2507-2812_t